MCNTIVSLGIRKSKPIPKEGYGWKIFRRDWLDRLYALVSACEYSKDKEGWIKWDTRDDSGFCFFLRKDQAKRCLNRWSTCNLVIRKIQYREGIQVRDERNMIMRAIYRVSLCKEFKILEE